MDFWVVAAAAGAGYVAKYWQSLSKEKTGSESFPADSIRDLSESRNILQPIRGRLPLSRDVSLDKKDVSDGNFSEINRLGSDAVTRVAGTGRGESYEDCNVLSLASSPPGLCGREISQEIGSNRRREFYDDSSLLPHFTMRETRLFSRFTRSKSLTSGRAHGHSVKPLNSLESCLTVQLYREHTELEEYVFSSLPSPFTRAVRPLFVTDGSQIISRASSDFKGEMRFGVEENGKLLGAPQLPKGSLKLPTKPKQNIGKAQSRRLSSSSARISSGLFHTPGSQNGMLLFFLGITIGIISAGIANKKEVDKLSEMLKQTENLVQDLHEELEMKDSLTVKELANEVFESQDTNEWPFFNGDPSALSTDQELDISKRYDSREPHNQKAENSGSMSRIEAELEAELERLELNMKASTLERISNFVELDPDFVPDVVQGDLRLDRGSGQPGLASNSDHDMSNASTNDLDPANYAVSPRELSLRLHEVIQSRLQARIMELESALQDSQNRVHSMESEGMIFQRDSYSEAGSSSVEESPTSIDEGNEIDRPLVIHLTGDALDAYNEAYEEIAKITKTDEETPAEVMHDTVHIQKERIACGTEFFRGQNGECNRSISHCDNTGDRWPESLVQDKTRTWCEQTSRSWESNEVGESDDEDDEIGKLLIKQLVEKTRQGSPLVLSVQRMLYSMDEQTKLE